MTLRVGRPVDAALILCGGQSRRMGSDKAALAVGHEAMLQRIVRLVGREASLVLVVAAEGQSLPTLPGEVRVVRDEVADRGPLQGLATGLAALSEQVDRVYVTATDGPLLQGGWVALLSEQLDDRAAAVPVAGDRWHPLAALYRRGPALRAARALLNQGERRMVTLIDAIAAVPVAEADLRAVDPDLLTLQNANRPDDYRAILNHLAGSPNGLG